MSDAETIDAIWKEADAARELLILNGHALDDVDDLALLFALFSPLVTESDALRSEVSRLSGEVERLAGTLATETKERERVRDLGVTMRRERDEARALLREVEWVQKTRGPKRCHFCGYQKNDRILSAAHSGDCRLALALSRAAP